MVHSLSLALLLAVAAPGAAQQATAALAAQAAAWNRGDLETTFGAYCDTTGMTWVNRGGVTRGFKSFADGMRADFKDRSRMGRMSYEVLDARSLGPQAATTTIRWQIARDGNRIMGGVSTQLWQRCRGRLRVVLEHAS